MNPLAGGLIPQNESLFASARLPGDGSTAEAALRFASSRPGVTCVLAGIACRRDWEQAEHAFSGWTPAPGEAERRLRAAQGRVCRLRAVHRLRLLPGHLPARPAGAGMDAVL